MITFIKILLILAITGIFVYLLTPAKGKLKKFFPASALRYEWKDNRKNTAFILLALVEFIVVALVFSLLDQVASFISSIPYVGAFFSYVAQSFSSQLDYIIFTVRLVLVNFALLAGFVVLKFMLKKGLLDHIFGIRKKEKEEKKKKKEEEKKGEESEEESATPLPQENNPRKIAEQEKKASAKKEKAPRPLLFSQ